MTRKITMNGDEPSDGAQPGFASLTDQWIDTNWYLPSDADQSWREREAQRLFGGKDAVDSGEPLPVEADSPAPNTMDGAYQPEFKRGWALNVLVPVSLATGALLIAIVFLMPGVWTAGFWGLHEPNAPPDMPRVMSDTAIATQATPRMIEASVPDQATIKAVRAPLPQQIAPVVAPREIGSVVPLPKPRPQMPDLAKQDRQNDTLAARVAKALPVRKAAPEKRAAKSLPPIGAHYFAARTPVVAARKSAAGKPVAAAAPPIGQAYFESHAPARAD
ncbi:MAG TPA: hypothetical protein VGM68_09875 [Rhizomicrobium sp.]|jgi:hypothetical protein